MTVAEFIVELQKMPQGMNVYALDQDGCHFPAEISVKRVAEWDYEELIDKRGVPYLSSIRESYREVDAVIVWAT